MPESKKETVNSKCFLIPFAAAVVLLACAEPNKYVSKQEKAAAAMPLYRALNEMENTGEPYYKNATARLLARLEEAGNPTEMRSWAEPVLSTNATLKEASILSSQKLPSSLLKLGLGDSPVIAVVPNTKTGKPFVIVDWGGGLGHQGIAIGDREFFPENPDFYYLKWVEGIFVYHSAR